MFKFIKRTMAITLAALMVTTSVPGSVFAEEISDTAVGTAEFDEEYSADEITEDLSDEEASEENTEDEIESEDVEDVLEDDVETDGEDVLPDEESSEDITEEETDVNQDGIIEDIPAGEEDAFTDEQIPEEDATNEESEDVIAEDEAVADEELNFADEPGTFKINESLLSEYGDSISYEIKGATQNAPANEDGESVWTIDSTDTDETIYLYIKGYNEITSKLRVTKAGENLIPTSKSDSYSTDTKGNYILQRYDFKPTEIEGMTITFNEIIDIPGYKVTVETGSSYIEGVDVYINNGVYLGRYGNDEVFNVSPFENYLLAKPVLKESAAAYHVGFGDLKFDGHELEKTANGMYPFYVGSTGHTLTIPYKAEYFCDVFGKDGYGLRCLSGVYQADIFNDGIISVGIWKGEDSAQFTDVEVLLNGKDTLGSGICSIKDGWIEIDGMQILAPRKSDSENVELKAYVKENDEILFEKSFLFRFYANNIVTPTSYTIKGFAKDNSITLLPGTEYEFPVKVNKGADLNGMALANGSSGNFCTCEYADGKLKIKAALVDAISTKYKDFAEGEDEFAFYPAGMLGEPMTANGPIGGKFKVKVSASPLKTVVPKFEIARYETDCIYFNVGEVKQIPYANTLQEMPLFYHVKATAVDTVAVGFVEENEMWIPYNDKDRSGLQCLNMLKTPAEYVEGTSQKYNFTAEIVMFKESDVQSTANYSGATVLTSSTVKTIKNVSTKPVYYETKLKIKKNVSSVFARECYLSDKDILLGTVVFSKKASMTKIDIEKSYILDSTGRKFFGWDGYWGFIKTDEETGTKIYLSKDYDLEEGGEIAPGKAELHVLADQTTNAKNGKPVEAVMTFTVKEEIDLFRVEFPNEIAKLPGKSYSFKLNPEFLREYYESWDKCLLEYSNPSVKKLKVINESSGPIAEFVSEKNGTVTLDADYTISAKDSDNYIKLKIVPNDFERNPLSRSYTKTITIHVVDGKDVKVKDAAVFNCNLEDIDDYSYYLSKPKNLIATNGDSVEADRFRCIFAEKPYECRSLSRAVLRSEEGTVIEGATWKASNKNIRIKQDGTITEILKPGKVTLTGVLYSGKDKITKKITFTILKTDVEARVTAETYSNPIIFADGIGENPSGNADIFISVGALNDTPVNSMSKFINKNWKVKVSGAKVLDIDKKSSAYCDMYTIMPTESQTVITVTQGKNRKVYTIKNLGLAEETLKLKNKSATIHLEETGSKYSSLNQTITFKLKEGFKPDTDKYYYIVRCSMEGGTDDKYVSFVCYLETEPELSLVVVPVSMHGMKTGNYKINISVTAYRESDHAPEVYYKPIAATLKITKPLKTSVKFASSYVLNKDTLKTDVVGNVKNGKVYYKLYDCNTNGKINDFSNKFTLDSEGRIGLAYGVKPEDIKEEDCTGYLCYYLYDINDNFICEKYQKIKIKIK